jgi:hypothetical protein
MKQRLVVLFLGIAFLTVLSSMTMLPSDLTKGLNVALVAKEKLKVQLIGENNTGKTLKVKIIKIDNNYFGYYSESVIYTEKITADITKINKTLDLSKLDNGKYEIHVKAGKKQITQYLDLHPKPTEKLEEMRVISFN